MQPTRENEELEFKKTTAELKPAVVSLASMLNKHGHGVVLFGVRNDGSVSGQAVGKNTTRDISRAVKENLRPAVSPSISVEERGGKQVVKVEAFGDDAPYSAYGRYYLRSDDEDLVMTNSQLEALFMNKNLDYSKWERTPTELSEADVDERLLIDYIDRGNEAGRIPFMYRDAADALVRLGLMDGGHLNNAGEALFGATKPLALKLAVYPTDERLSFIDNRIFRGNIFECIEAAWRYIAENTRWQAEVIGMERVERPEVPVEAVREIVVNSFAHMHVTPGLANEVYITPTRIHVANPGFLVKGLDPHDFASGRVGPVARNPLINAVLYLNKTIESFGTGFGRVFALCEREGIECRYGNNEFGFVFEFMRKAQAMDGGDDALINATVNASVNSGKGRLKSDDAANEIRLSETDHLVLDAIREHPRIKKGEIAELVGRHETTVSRAIGRLTKRGLVERVGSNKTGFWRAV